MQGASEVKHMKITMMIIVTAIVGSAAYMNCGKEESKPAQQASQPCSSSMVTGSWAGTIAGEADTLTFGPDCVGTSSRCQSTFTFPNISAASGDAIVIVTSTSNKGNCMKVGQYTCSYSINNNQLAYDCGSGAIVYTRQ